jgi:hypothetical protein
MIEDEDGRTWESVRDGFWQGELGLPDIRFAPEQHELLLRVLTSIDRHCLDKTESRYDLFDGDMRGWRFYMSWLASIGMLERSNRLGEQISPFEAGLSREGRSVLMMLQATREPAWEGLPMADVMDAILASSGGMAEDERESALQGFERAIGPRRHVFARERVGRAHVVTLTSIRSGVGARMPMRGVTWSMPFTDAGARNDLFAWLATRVDRWDDWGELAYGKGGEALTRHLLGLIVALHAPDFSS